MLFLLVSPKSSHTHLSFAVQAMAKRTSLATEWHASFVSRLSCLFTSLSDNADRGGGRVSSVKQMTSALVFSLEISAKDSLRFHVQHDDFFLFGASALSSVLQ